MIVFVTGATGVLGRPVVQRLIQNGHQVRSLSRSESNRSALQDAGAIALERVVVRLTNLTAAILVSG